MTDFNDTKQVLCTIERQCNLPLDDEQIEWCLELAENHILKRDLIEQYHNALCEVGGFDSAKLALAVSIVSLPTAWRCEALIATLGAAIEE